jgi:hypothetical protein
MQCRFSTPLQESWFLQIESVQAHQLYYAWCNAHSQAGAHRVLCSEKQVGLLNNPRHETRCPAGAKNVVIEARRIRAAGNDERRIA